MDLIKQIYIDNGLEELWNKYLEGESIDVVIRQLNKDIGKGRIVLPEPTPGEEEAYANIEEIIAKADAEGLIPIPGYRRGRTIELGIPDEAYEELKIEEKEVGTVEDIYTKIEEEKENKQKAEEELEKKFGPMTSWDSPELGFAGVDIDDKWRKTSITEYMTERPEDIARYIKDTREDRGIKSLNVPIENLEGDETGFVLRIDKDGKLEGFDERTGNTFNPRTLEVIDNDYFKEPILKPSDKKFKASEGDGKKETKEGDTRIDENGITWIYKNGEWVLYETPASDEGPKEGDTKIENGITYIFQNGEWVVLPTGAEGGGQEGSGEQQEGNAGDIYDFLNIPEGAYLWDVDGTNYIVYEVPGSNGELYEGNPIFMAYEVQENDIVKAGIYSPEAPSLTGSPVSKIFFDKIAIVTGNTDQLSADIDNPFASFVETIGEQALVAPWIKDPEMISLIAEAAVEGRTVTDAEWQVTDWYQEHNDSEREWLRTYYSDPSTAAQLTTDSQLAVANSLQASGVSNAPEALINWVAGRYVSGEWSDAYTTEQIALFADPYAQGKRDAQFETYLSSTAITGVDRTTAREREVEELFATWLGPTLGKLTDQEKSEMAGRLRDDPDYKDTLIGSLKQSRLAAFSNYTNPELTYDDIARPWRNLTTSVWGQTADETQGWWQEMVKSNDFATAQTTLREKGLENNVTQVTQDATQALTQALGEGLSTQGVNQ